ncbi:cytochrome P450 [Winogradskya consettensis]|uniref:Cytochrome P450 n=1 Tax=Winogradskya consettensis TaxID=113560 RepID=A0A919VIN6_9ACTN|nr:cytochrome P450 [Actinoplanes consettensis]GIM67263.1 cytochrome P450 [Actinoplanes consettensis]
MIPEIQLSDPAVLNDPVAAYERAREQGPVARMSTPGFGSMWVVTRHAEAKAMLSDSRFELSEDTYLRPQVPEHCQKYLRTMHQTNGDEHARVRRLVSPAFSARRAEEFRPRITQMVEASLDDIPAGTGAPVDLVPLFAQPLPVDVICELLAIPLADRESWRRYGVAIATGHGADFMAAVPAIMDDAAAAVAHRAQEPGEDLLSQLIGQENLSDVELVTLVWNLILAGQTPAGLIINAVDTLLRHPDQLAALLADESLLPGAVEELTRWCGPQLLSLPRFAQEDVEIGGVRISEGDAVSACLASANRDPRAFSDAGRLDLRREPGRPGHLAYAHGPHFCLGAAFARVQIEVALSSLLRRFPGLRPADDTVRRVPDPGAWRVSALPVLLPASL